MRTRVLRLKHTWERARDDVYAFKSSIEIAETKRSLGLAGPSSLLDFPSSSSETLTQLNSRWKDTGKQCPKSSLAFTDKHTQRYRHEHTTYTDTHSHTHTHQWQRMSRRMGFDMASRSKSHKCISVLIHSLYIHVSFFSSPSNSIGFPFRKLKNQGSQLRGCPRVAKLVSHRAHLPMAPLADAKAHELSDFADS